MKALEQDLGCRLLDRLGKKMALTEAGEAFLKHAERILAEMEIARTTLDRLGKWGQSRLRVGTSTTLCQYFLPAVIREFRESFPRCQLSIELGDTPDLISALAAQRIDLALGMEPMWSEPLEFRKLFTDHLEFLLSPQHPWVQRGSVDRQELNTQQFILYGKGSHTAELIRRYFAEEDVALQSTTDMGSIEAIKELVKLGLGVSILAPWTFRQDLAAGIVASMPLGRRKLRRQWGVLYAKHKSLSLVEETFVGLCRQASAGLQISD